MGERLKAIRGTPVGPVVSFDGTRLHAEEIGAGPTVVLAHGFCLDSGVWRHQLKDLPDRFRLVLLDQRGHGLSDRPAAGDWSIDAFARDLATVIDAVSPDQAVTIVGHSMGGMALLRFCALHPELLGERVSGIALVDATASDVIGGMLPGAAKMAYPALRLIEEAAVRAAASRPDAFDRIRAARADLVALLVKLMGFGPNCPPEELASVAAGLARVPAEVMVPVIQTLRALDVREGLAHIDVPALVVVGSRDRMTPPAAAQRLADDIPHATLAVIRGAGHMPMLEKPEAFNARLSEFLATPGAMYGGRRVRLSRIRPD